MEEYINKITISEMCDNIVELKEGEKNGEKVIVDFRGEYQEGRGRKLVYEIHWCPKEGC